MTPFELNNNSKYMHNKTIIKLFGLGVICTLLCSCATNYTFSSNLDPKNIQGYFSPSQVEIYTDENEFHGQYKFIGLVEGQDCQQKAYLAAPDKITARTQARKNAFALQANAIIFTGCALINNDNKNTKACHATLVCYGKAFQVEHAIND